VSPHAKEFLQMHTNVLSTTACAMFSPGKGLLAMDESTPTCDKRFAALGIPQTEERRRAYRELLVTAPGLSDSISAAIVYDEMIRQKLSTGESFVDALLRAGIIPGSRWTPARTRSPGFPARRSRRVWTAWPPASTNTPAWAPASPSGER
jgi:fructose-bisphosphate aldolase, class I